MEPRYLLMLKHLLLWCDVDDERSVKGPKGPRDGVLVSVVAQLGVTRPCVGRDPVRFSGRHSRGVSMWQWEVPWPDHLLEIQFPIRNPVRF